MESSNNESQFSMPLGLRYNLGVNDAVPSTKNIAQFLSSNASDFTESNNTIRIPIGSPGFLDLKNSLLQMEVENTSSGGTTTAQLDGGADGLIRKISLVSSDGSIIEEIHQYGLLSSVLDQYTSSSGKQNVSSTLKGAPQYNDNFPEFTSFGAGTNTVTNRGITITAAGAGAMTLSSLGGIGYDQSQSDILNTGIKRTYMFPLKLGTFNLATSKLLPPQTNMTLVLELNNATNCLKCAASTPGYTVRNVEFHCPVIMIKDQTFLQRINQRMAQGLVMKCNTYQHFVNTTASVSSGTSTDVSQISARARSLKGLMTIFRLQSNTTDKDEFSLSRRSIQYLDNFIYRIGSQNYPNDRINVKCAATPTAGGTSATDRPIAASISTLNISEAYSHALRLTGGLNNPSADILIGKQSFAGSEKLNGTGIAAVDLSAYADSSVSSGIATLDNMPISFEYTKNTAASGILQLDTYAVVEMTLVRSPDGVLSSFV